MHMDSKEQFRTDVQYSYIPQYMKENRLNHDVIGYYILIIIIYISEARGIRRNEILPEIKPNICCSPPAAPAALVSVFD